FSNASKNKRDGVQDKNSTDGSTRHIPNVPLATVAPLVRGVQPGSGSVDSGVELRFRLWNPICMCGKKWNNHTIPAKAAYMEGETCWNKESNTVPVSSDTFGEVEFVGFGQKVSKYIRVEHKTNMKTMLHLLQDLWCLPPPNLLISVTGGAQDFTMVPGLKEVFRRGLMKAAESTEIEDQIPIVCVVLEGGAGTLETVKEAIANGIPAVIV
ncbi:hypothetical protein LSH36_582g03043, partial [Paralvinella palmiformis]